MSKRRGGSQQTQRDNDMQSMIAREVARVKRIAEEHYRDACDIEFTVQDGRFFVNAIRPATKRSPEASLRFALQFLAEGRIDVNEALSRIAPEDVAKLVQPEIRNRPMLETVGRGLPASGGAATGRVAFSAEAAIRLTRPRNGAILVKEEINRRDTEGARTAAGVLTARGGMTSHAALWCPKWGKPCVVGCSALEFDAEVRHAVIAGHRISEGDWVTIDGTHGVVFLGKGDVMSRHWREFPELSVLSELLRAAIAADLIREGNVGHCWHLRDFFMHGAPLAHAISHKRRQPVRRDYASFTQPTVDAFDQMWKSLEPVPPAEERNYSLILMGLYLYFARVLADKVGLGRHHRYMRPLFDPSDGRARRNHLQLVGLEFFGINRFLPFMIDIAQVTVIFAVAFDSDEELWFLDLTSPAGESLVANSPSIRAFTLKVNGAIVAQADLPSLYGVLRKREGYWRWFEYNKTSYAELVHFLRRSKQARAQNWRMAEYARELGLLNGEELTHVGLSLITSE